MRRAVAVLCIQLATISTASAAFTDFSDYTQLMTSFAAGESFSSGDLSFRAISFIGVSNPVRIYAPPGYALLLPGPGVEFLLPAGTREVSFRYVDGARTALAINGSTPSPLFGPGAGFSYLGGTSLGGVSIDADATYQIHSSPSSGSVVNYEEGFLNLRGPISSLIIAGLELNIDDVTVLVPEPAAAGLAACAVFALIASRRRMKTAY